MQFINNKRLKAGELLLTALSQRSSLSVITALFSIYALEKLESVLPSIETLRLLFSSPLEIQDPLALVGDSDERRLRNHLTQQNVAKKCEEWLSAHAEILQMTSASLVHQNLFCTEKIAIQGSADLTASGLGFTSSTCPEHQENFYRSACMARQRQSPEFYLLSCSVSYFQQYAERTG